MALRRRVDDELARRAEVGSSESGGPGRRRVRVAKEAADGRDVVVLGANVARRCLEAGLLDEIIVHVAPVLVGDGVRLFERSGGEPVKLALISSKVEGETTVLRYAVGEGTDRRGGRRPSEHTP
jgi:riboflavin biosynthesis pyrimidine reductase